MSRKSSEATRVRILESTWKLLNTDGARSRMADVAKEAGVSRQAVYLHFPSRAELLIATTRHIDEVEDVAGQLEAVFSAESGVERVAAFVNAWCNYIPIVHGGAKTLLSIKDTDADAAAAWQDRMTGLYKACGQVVATLDSDGVLTADLTTAEATDVMWATVSVGQWELLTIDRNMSQQRYLELTHRSLMELLVAD